MSKSKLGYHQTSEAERHVEEKILQRTGSRGEAVEGAWASHGTERSEEANHCPIGCARRDSTAFQKGSIKST